MTTGQQAILEVVTKKAETLAVIYQRYRATQSNPMLLYSAYTVLGKLCNKGCVEQPSKGHYRATGREYYSNKGQNRPESRYIKAIRELGGKEVTIDQIIARIERQAHVHNIRLKPDQAKRVKPALLTALSYLSKLKAQGRVLQDEEGRFGLPKTKEENDG